MAVKEIEATQAIDVTQLCVLLYGQPGSRKSSLVQTSQQPITFATDPGIYRAFGRQKAVTFDTWQDVVSYDLAPYKTVGIDTVGMAIDKLSSAIIQENPKNGNRLGGLSLPGYGVLRSRFAAWVGDLRQKQIDIVFTAHEKAAQFGDELYYCPDVVGGSYNTLMNHCDLVGYLHFANGKRVLDFTPTDRWMAKCPPTWGKYIQGFQEGPLGTIVLPDFGKEPSFLATLLEEAKASMGQISAASAEIARIVTDWTNFLSESPDLARFNSYLPQLSKLQNGAKAQCWHICQQYAASRSWELPKGKKNFVEKAGAA